MESKKFAKAFTNYWKNYAKDKISNDTWSDQLFTHPDDRDEIEKWANRNEEYFCKVNSWESFLKSELFTNIHFSKKFAGNTYNNIHLGLPPAPYAGDIENAKIILLLTNPGVSPTSYFLNYEIFSSTSDRLSHLTSRNRYLNPERSWTPGYIYGIKRFRRILNEIHTRTSQEKNSKKKALSLFRKNIAVLQLSPYASKEVNYKIIKDLPTTRKAKELAAKLARDRLVIIGRSKNYWDLDSSNDSIIELSNPRNPTFDDDSVKIIVDRIFSAR